MKWRCLLETIGAAAAIGASDAAVTALQGGQIRPKDIGQSAAIGGVIAVLNLIRQSPRDATRPPAQTSPKS